MKNSNLEKKQKKLPKYAIHWDRFVSIYIIIVSIVRMSFVVSLFYRNQDSDIEKSWIESIFLLFWCFILGMWIYKLVQAIKQKNLKERLSLEGNRIIAIVTDIKSEWIMLKFWDSVLMWRWSWFKIHAKYEDKLFISPKIWINVPKYVEIWDKIPVFVDLQNPEEYYMDLDNINSN